MSPNNTSNQGSPKSDQAKAQVGGSLAAQMKKFDIPQFVKDHYPDLIPLIIETESMNDEERQYWFSILPVMTDDQIVKLREILLNEKQQLEKLDENYAKELKRINDEQIIKLRETEAKEKWAQIRDAEKESEEAEAAQEEEIFKQLQGL